MISLLPKIALVVCVVVFVVVIVRTVFYRKSEIKHLSELPLNDESDD